ncbi:probable cytochrome P450 309a2 [Episyrphus balteatus]|uniref:probable cytochrome P450 309a2 n=1 Tax=Episyrphus balteatus TaxID=286459 RepID=UPI0024850E75|nr:probable cytochrome P450 309a2 [Episyrphus balteatus]
MADLTLSLFFLTAIGGLIYLYLSWNFDFWKKRGVKGPEPKLIFGSIPSIVKRNRNLAFDMQELYEKYKKSGERFIGIFMTRNPQILVIDPSLAREIMITNFKSFRDNEPSLWVRFYANKKLENVAPINPFLTEGSEWKRLRSEFMGGLSPAKVKQAHPIVTGICHKLINYLNASIQKSGNKIEIKQVCYKFTIEIVTDFIWGVNADALKVDDAPNKMFIMARTMIEKSFLKIGYYYITGLVPFIRKITNKRFYPEETDKFFAGVQKDALELRLRSKNDRPDYLNYLIQLQEKKNISLEDMTGHSLTVLLDTFETTGSVIAHTLYYLANDQNTQNKLRTEIMANLNEEGNMSYDVLTELPYLDQCIMETIRIITYISVSSRMCSEETYLECRPNHKVKIEPGMILHIPTYSFHHDAEIFANPNEYIPERFDDDRAKELNQQGYFVPFGDGPRICGGMKFGQLESKAAVVEVLKNFRLKRENNGEELTLNPTSFILGLSGDFNVEFESIQK